MRRSHLIRSRLTLGLAAATLAVTSPSIASAASTSTMTRPSIASAASTPTKTSVTPKVAITSCSSGWQLVSDSVWAKKCIQDTDGYVRVYAAFWNRSFVTRTVWDYQYIQDTRPPNVRTTFVQFCVLVIPPGQLRYCTSPFLRDTWHPKRAADRIRVLPSPSYLIKYSPVIP